VVDGGHPTIDTFVIRPNAYPAKILEKCCPTWPDNRGCTVPKLGIFSKCLVYNFLIWYIRKIWYIFVRGFS